MPLSKLLWSSLYGAATIVALLVGSWMRDVTVQQNLAEQRLNLVESRYAAIDQDLRDLREDLHDLKSEIKEHNAHK